MSSKANPHYFEGTGQVRNHLALRIGAHKQRFLHTCKREGDLNHVLRGRYLNKGVKPSRRKKKVSSLFWGKRGG